MSVSLIVAMAKNRVIGLNNQMPWHLPADLKHFRQLTLHKPIVMGRKTYDSIGCVLPKRRNVVITRQNTLDNSQIDIYHSLTDALSALDNEPEVMVIGGQMIFAEAMPLAERLFITEIDLQVEGDTFFPAWNASQWELVNQIKHDKDSDNPYNYCFKTYKRINWPE